MCSLTLSRTLRFYTLLVLSTALFGKPPFKNVIVNGLVLARSVLLVSPSVCMPPPPPPPPNKISGVYTSPCLCCDILPWGGGERTREF